MNIALVLAAVTAIATTMGGLLAIKSRDRLHIVLGLAAGLLLGLVAFDLLPEVFELNTNEILHAPAVSVAFVAGFMLLHLFERALGSHEPSDSEYATDHKHTHNIAGTVGALTLFRRQRVRRRFCGGDTGGGGVTGMFLISPCNSSSIGTIFCCTAVMMFCISAGLFSSMRWPAALS